MRERERKRVRRKREIKIPVGIKKIIKNFLFGVYLTKHDEISLLYSHSNEEKA